MSFSIIIPNLNGEAHLRECVESALSFVPPERIVFVDNGSIDSSVEIATKLIGAEQVHNCSRRGAPAARNTGLKHVITDYVLFLDSDDVLFAIDAPEIEKSMASGADLIIGRSMSFRGGQRPHTEKGFKSEASRWDILSGYATDNVVQTGGILFKRSAFAEYGDWDERVRRGQDVEIVLRWLLRGSRFRTSTTPLVGYRDVSQRQTISTSVTRASLRSQTLSLLRLSDLAKGECAIAQKSIGKMLYSQSRLHFIHGDKLAGRLALQRAQKLSGVKHFGSLSHKVASSVLGLGMKERISWAFSKR